MALLGPHAVFKKQEELVFFADIEDKLTVDGQTVEKIVIKNEKIPYDTLRRFKYTSLEAERDNFSLSTDKLGSKSLIHFLYNH
mgnify:CR=1 FL=1